MNYLALNTAGDSCSVALSMNGTCHQREDHSGERQSRMLPALVAHVLAEGGIAAPALDGVVCCIGPGAFAAVRVGVAFAKGLALALDVPVAGVSSLALLARQAALRHGAATIFPALDARMGQVYAAVYVADARMALQLHAAACVATPAGLPRITGLPRVPLIGCGSGWRRYRDTLVQRCPTAPDMVLEDAVPQARDAFGLVLGSQAAEDAFVTAAQLTPVYLRNHVALTLAERGKPQPKTS